MKISLIICDDRTIQKTGNCAMKKPSWLCAMSRIHVSAKEQQVMVAKTMAWMNNVYVAVANASGSDGVYVFWPLCNRRQRRAHLLANGHEAPGVNYAQLSISGIAMHVKTTNRRITYSNFFTEAIPVYIIPATGTKASLNVHFSFYETWVNNPELAQKQVEELTRNTIVVTAVADCTICPTQERETQTHSMEEDLA